MNMPHSSVPQIALRTKHELLAGQIHNCLTLVATLTNCIRLALGQRSDALSSGETPTEGDRSFSDISLSSLERSLSRACQRLDTLLASDSDWKLPGDDVHTAGMKILAQNIIMNSQQIQGTRLSLDAVEQRLAQETAAIKAALEKALEDGSLFSSIPEEPSADSSSK